MVKSPKTTTAPTRQIAPFGLRMLPELREKIEQTARGSGRSMNAEIVARLEGSFAQHSGAPSRLWQCFFDLVRIQSKLETSQEMVGSYHRDAKELLRRKLDLFAGAEASSEAEEIDERLRQVESLAARLEAGQGELMAKRVDLEDELGSMLEQALGAQQKKGDSF